MQRRNTAQTAPITVDSMATLTQRKAQLDAQLDDSETRMADLWHDMCTPSAEERSGSPTQKLLNHVASASAVIDGALLGWKLYRRFGGTLNLFRRKKKK